MPIIAYEYAISLHFVSINYQWRHYWSWIFVRKPLLLHQSLTINFISTRQLSSAQWVKYLNGKFSNNSCYSKSHKQKKITLARRQITYHCLNLLEPIFIVIKKEIMFAINSKSLFMLNWNYVFVCLWFYADVNTLFGHISAVPRQVPTNFLLLRKRQITNPTWPHDFWQIPPRPRIEPTTPRYQIMWTPSLALTL